MRTKLIEAILKVSQQNNAQEEAIKLGCYYLSDTNLIALAMDLGIDTDSILTPVEAL